MTKNHIVELYDNVLSHFVKNKNLILDSKYFDKVIKNERIEPCKLKTSILKLLTSPLEVEDGDFVEASLYFMGVIGEPDNWNTILCELMININHHSHEIIIREIQLIRSEYSIPYLKLAVELKPELRYLDYDDYGSYYKKCLWALVAIGTKESKDIIEKCTFSQILELKKAAIYRLSKLD